VIDPTQPRPSDLVFGGKEVAKPRRRLWAARLGTFAGIGALAAGAGVEWGPGWSLMVAGAACGTWFLLVYDVDDGG
jgi:hypothetical protein